MHQALIDAERALCIELPQVRAAAERTARNVAVARAAVHERLELRMGDASTDSTGLDILAFGSMAREEMVPGSDFDYLVVANKLGPRPGDIHHHRDAAAYALEQVAATKPGRSGLFGVMVAAPDLVNAIGLDADTNKGMTRRVLVLQESVALNRHDARDTLMRAIVNRYLFDYDDDPGPLVPRFLVNDILRYWRTVAVDYQAKRWEEMAGQKWGLRYIKLRSSRKWTSAGTFASVLMPVVEQKTTTASYLCKQFDTPALARLAQLSEHVPEGSDAARALAQVLVLADWFVGYLADPGHRDDAALVSDPTDPSNPASFRAARDKTQEIQTALEDLFFSSAPLVNAPAGTSLGGLSRKYMSF